MKAGAILASTNTHTSRSIIFPGFIDAASSSYGGYAAQGFGELGYRLPFHGTLWSYVPGLSGLIANYEPFLQGAVIHIDQNRYAELALNAGLVGAARGYDLGTTILGLRTQYQLASLPGFTWTSLLGWRHAFGDVIPKVNQTFVGTFSNFTVAGYRSTAMPSCRRPRSTMQCPRGSRSASLTQANMAGAPPTPPSRAMSM